MKRYFLLLIFFIFSQTYANYGFTDHIAKNVINSPILESCAPGNDIRSDEFTYQKMDATGQLPYIRYYSTALSNNFLIQDTLIDGGESIGGWKDNYSNYLTVSDFGGKNINRIRLHLTLPGDTTETFYSADVVNGAISNLKRIKSPDPIMYYSVERDGRSSIRDAFGTIGEMSINHGDTRIEILKNKQNITQTSNVTNVEGLEFIVYKNGDTYYFKNIIRGGVDRKDAVYKAVWIKKSSGKEIEISYSLNSGTIKRVIDNLGNFIEFSNFIKDTDAYSIQYEYPQTIYLGRFKLVNEINNLTKLITSEELNNSQVININYSSFSWYNYKANNRLEKIYVINSVKSTENGYEYYYYGSVNPISFQVSVGGVLTGRWESGYAVPSLTAVRDSSSRIMREITYGSDYSNWYSKITSTAGPGRLLNSSRVFEGGFLNDNTKKWEKRYSLNFLNYVKSSYRVYGDTKSRIVNMSFDGFPCITYNKKPVSYIQFDIIENRINTLIDNNNITTHFTYDSFGRITSIKEAVGNILERITSYTYNNEPEGYLTPIILSKPLKTITNEVIDGRVYTSTETYKLSNKSKITRYSYTKGLLASIILPDGERVSYSYNPNGLLEKETKIKNSFINIINFQNHNSSGQPQIIHNGNSTTRITYNSNNKPIIISENNGAFSRTKKFNYDNNNGYLLSEVDFDDIKTSYTYNDAGFVLKKELGGVSEILNYDLNGNLLSIDSLDNTTKRILTKTYNTNGQLYETRFGNDKNKMWTRYLYDNNGNIINKSTLSPVNNGISSLTNTYDALNRIKSYTDPNNKEYSYTYDESDNIIEYKAPSLLSAWRSFFVDSELDKDSSNDYGIKTYSYTLGSELLSYSHAGIRECKFSEYNFYGKYSKLECNDINKNISDYNVNYRIVHDTSKDLLYSAESNNNNNLPTPKFWGANTKYSYDLFDRIARKSQKIGILQNVDNEKILHVDYQYTNGNKLKKIIYPSGNVVDFIYDSTSGPHIKRINVNSNNLLTTNYEHKLIKNIFWGNGNQSEFVYDDSNNLISNNNEIIGNQNKNFTYSYYNSGHLRNKTYGHISNNYSYDAKGQIIKEERYSNQLLNFSHLYTYDNNGNRIGFISNGLQSPYPFTSANYSYLPNSNRFATINHDSNFVSFNYEHTGELQLPDLIGNANYDFFGRRLRQVAGINNQFSNYIAQYNHKNERVYSGLTSDLARQYIYDEEGHLLGEYNVNGVPFIEYIWLEDTPIAALVSGKIIYILSDNKDTPFLGINSINNELVWEWVPDAFGVSTPSLETIKINLRFPGQYYDVTTGLHYNLNRYYNPSLGRYMEADPTGLKGGWNPYVYAENDPVNNIDPTGLIVPIPLILYAAGLTLTIDGLSDGEPPQIKGAKFTGAISDGFKQTPLSQGIQRGMTETAKTKSHGNKLNNTPAEGYTLRNKSGDIQKFGETTRGEAKFGVGQQKRYSRKFLKDHDLEYIVETSGNKIDMHRWQHLNILNYKMENGGQRPPLNKSDY